LSGIGVCGGWLGMGVVDVVVQVGCLLGGVIWWTTALWRHSTAFAYRDGKDPAPRS